MANGAVRLSARAAAQLPFPLADPAAAIFELSRQQLERPGHAPGLGAANGIRRSRSHDGSGLCLRDSCLSRLGVDPANRAATVFDALPTAVLRARTLPESTNAQYLDASCRSA